MDAQTESKLDAFVLLQTSIEVPHGSKNSQPSPYCSLGVILMGLGIAKIDEETITKELGDVPIIASNHLRTGGLVGTDHGPVLFGVELGGEFGRIHEVAEHHRELAAFGVGRGRGHWGWCARGRLGFPSR